MNKAKSYQVTILLLFMTHLCLTKALGIDDKLDFGHSKSIPSFIRDRADHKNQFLPVKYTTVVKDNDNVNNFDNIGVVCTSGGCNITKPENDTERDLNADVVVHVETRVNLKPNKTKAIVEETPDIPVVIGYAGAQRDAAEVNGIMPNYKSIYTYNENPVRVPNFSPLYSNSRSAFVPSYAMPGIISYSPMYKHSPYHHTSASDSNNYYPSKTYTNSYNPTVQADSFSNLEPNVNINIKTLPPIAVSVSGSDQSNDIYNRHMNKGMGVVIPYFEPSYHNHHYGEHPPPQYIHYPKTVPAYNPVEFKTVKATWSPSVLYKSLPHRHTSTMIGNEVKCPCQNEQSVPGMRWYPTANRKNFNADPGLSIDDKLAPLN